MDQTKPIHLYISPHLDDAVFSCGGMIAEQVARQDRVIVLTVCAGAPAEGAISDYARSLHARWGQAPEEAVRAAANMVEIRRQEDRAALALLGAEAIHLGVPDVIYRRVSASEASPAADSGTAGRWVVESDDALFEGWDGRESALRDRLADLLVEQIERLAAEHAQPVQVYGPLALGDHRDHHLVRSALARCVESGSLDARALRLWEDLPYAAMPEGLLDPRVQASPDRRPEVCTLGESALEAKIAAMGRYASQIGSFWEDERHMAEAVRSFHRERAEGLDAGAAVELLWPASS